MSEVAMQNRYGNLPRAKTRIFLEILDFPEMRDVFSLASRYFKHPDSIEK